MPVSPHHPGISARDQRASATPRATCSVLEHHTTCISVGTGRGHSLGEIIHNKLVFSRRALETMPARGFGCVWTTQIGSGCRRAKRWGQRSWLCEQRGTGGLPVSPHHRLEQMLGASTCHPPRHRKGDWSGIRMDHEKNHRELDIPSL